MNKASLFLRNKRIEVNQKVLAGKPVIKGTRIPVSLVLNLMANGYDIKKVRKAYPELTVEDIQAAISYSQQRIDREMLSSISEDLTARIAFA